MVLLPPQHSIVLISDLSSVLATPGPFVEHPGEGRGEERSEEGQ